MNKTVLKVGRYVVAVSGGVDSVVLLDKLASRSDLELIVAHFDHGIRDDSTRDTEFVNQLAKKYGFPFESRREELGEGASEELARKRRYAFLREVAKRRGAQLVTAHHADDVIETIAINIIRGTGWRGLAVLDSDVWRPLIDMTKAEIIQYAKENRLEWREDSTNEQDRYLRNRVRKQTVSLPNNVKRELLALWSNQKQLKYSIDIEVAGLISEGSGYDRQFFADLDEPVAMELIRRITRSRLTRPQQLKALYAIRTFLPAKVLQAGGGVNLRFTTRNFTVELIK